MLANLKLKNNVTEIRRFEARIYNAKVRSLVDAGDFNDTGFDDGWADSRLIEVRARSLDEALCLFQRDYPSHCGFKITAIVELPSNQRDAGGER